ncbi:hypothetical protein KC19_5G057500, partial [Ceratodon purpureus]
INIKDFSFLTWHKESSFVKTSLAFPFPFCYCALAIQLHCLELSALGMPITSYRILCRDFEFCWLAYMRIGCPVLSRDQKQSHLAVSSSIYWLMRV